MVIVLAIVTSLFFLQGISVFLIESLQQSVDISTFLKDSSQEEEILELKQALVSLPEVKEVIYVSKEDALAQFVERHKKDQVILDSLDAIGQNPLLASLNIKTLDLGSGDSEVKKLITNDFRNIHKVIISRNIADKFRVQPVDFFARS